MSGLTKISIRTLLGGLMGAMGLLLVCTSAVSFVDAVKRNSDAVQTALRTQISDHLFKALIPLRNERGAENTSLAAPGQAGVATLSDVMAYRQESERHYAESMRLLEKLAQPDFAPVITRLEASHEVMTGLRHRTDAAIPLDRPLRDPGLVKNFWDDTKPLLDDIVGTIDRLDASLKLMDPLVDQFLSVKRAAWTTRLNLGLMVARSQAAVASGMSLGPADMLAWSQDEARAILAWNLVLEAAARPDAPSSIVAAVAAGNAAMAGAEADARKEVIATLAAGQKLATPLLDLRRKDTENTGLIVMVANAALDRMVDRARNNALSARSTLMADVVVLLAALALAGVGVVIVHRKVTGPIHMMTHAMRRLAGQDMTVEIPGVGRGDEIGAMAAAVQVFRVSMITADRLAAEQETERVLKAQRAARLEQVVEELGIQNVRFGAALSNISQALCMFDAAGGLIVANDQTARMFGMDPASIHPGATIEIILAQAVGASTLDHADLEAMLASIQGMQAAGLPAAGDCRLADGRTLTVSFVSVEGDGWLLTMQDITERKLAETRITHLAHHDGLTGLPNRLQFRSKLAEAVARSRRGEPSALLFLDLDYFKTVNDTLGHAVGDALLQEVSKRLQAQVRECDMVARLGGDEFAIVQFGVDQPNDATALAERLIEALCLPYELSGHHVEIGTSVGIAVLPGDAEDADQLLKNADVALYGAKADGRRCFRFFEPNMHAVMQSRRSLELDLRRGFSEGEFEVYYQPIMSIKTRLVSGFEALLRWNHPERGLVPPLEFIPLAEEIGLIVPLGEWVLRQACSDAAGWPGDVKVAVNVSVVQFSSRTLVTDVAAALTGSGLSPQRLELEVTETVMLDDTKAILLVLHQLRDLGVGIAMDDFGSGHSSLNYLRRFPFSKVKIDRSFVGGLGTSADCNAIVTAVTGLCQTLGMQTVAEGVETEVQLRQLHLGSCCEAQGYLFSKPRPASEVVSLCQELNGTSAPLHAGRLQRRQVANV